MPGYVPKALTHFRHPPLIKSQDQPYPHTKPSYGAKTQHATAEDTTPPPSTRWGQKSSKKCAEFSFVARGINGSLLPAFSALASQQANPTERTTELCKQFLDYMA
jgi:hypothetical protein